MDVTPNYLSSISRNFLCASPNQTYNSWKHVHCQLKHIDCHYKGNWPTHLQIYTHMYISRDTHHIVLIGSKIDHGSFGTIPNNGRELNVRGTMGKREDNQMYIYRTHTARRTMKTDAWNYNSKLYKRAHNTPQQQTTFGNKKVFWLDLKDGRVGIWRRGREFQLGGPVNEKDPL